MAAAIFDFFGMTCGALFLAMFVVFIIRLVKAKPVKVFDSVGEGEQRRIMIMTNLE